MRLLEVIPATRIPLSQPQIYTYYTSLDITKGSLVLVPLNRRDVEGIVLESRDLAHEKIAIKHLGYELRAASKVLFKEKFLSDRQIELVKWLADYYNIPLGMALKVVMPKHPKKLEIKALAPEDSFAKENIKTESLEKLKNILQKIIKSDKHILLYNKNNLDLTDLYADLFSKLTEKQKQILILEPETKLAKNLYRKLENHFGEKAVLLDRDLPLKRYWQVWTKIRNNEAKIVVGTRSAIFAPVNDLGMLIVRNEHSSSYKQWDQQPRYDAKTIALKIANLTKAKIVFESATPSVEEYYRAKKEDIELIEITEQDNSAKRSVIEVVDMREELQKRNFSIISDRLREEITDSMGKKEKIVLFINRRGMATAVICRDCGTTIMCPDCDSPMVYHLLSPKTGKLLCHYCNRESDAPLLCPKCKSTRIKYIGAGTQKAVEAVKELFPLAKIKRLDSDMARGEEIALENINMEETDILIGTQMVLSDNNEKKFGLAGILNADTVLHLPDFRASERTFQLIYQLSAMAERTIIQTYNPENRTIQHLSRRDYTGFYEREIEDRKALSYPPFASFIKLIYTHKDLAKAKKEAGLLTTTLNDKIKKFPDMAKNMVEILGPAPTYTYKIKSQYQWQIVIKIKKGTNTEQNTIREKIKKNMLSLVPSGWLVDVNPISLL